VDVKTADRVRARVATSMRTANTMERPFASSCRGDSPRRADVRDGLLAMPEFREDLTWAFRSTGDTGATEASGDNRRAKAVGDERPGTPDWRSSAKPAGFADGDPIDPPLPPRPPHSGDPGPSGTDKSDGEGDQGASSE
jgi:hypothetical protein